MGCMCLEPPTFRVFMAKLSDFVDKSTEPSNLSSQQADLLIRIIGHCLVLLITYFVPRRTAFLNGLMGNKG